MKRYSKYITELVITKLTEQELLEMANITSKTTGIENVVIWIGPNPSNHWKRIKISNIPNKFDGKDCFILTIPDFKEIGERDKSVINDDKLEQIKNFVSINIDVINDYSDYLISTEDLLSKLKSIKKYK